MKSREVIATGAMPNNFANVIAEAIDAAQVDGLDLDVAVCVAVGVAADYARAEYGDGYLDALASIVKQRAGKPLPRPGNDVGKLKAPEWIIERLKKIACLDDKLGNQHLETTGSYACFDEPGSVRIAREILAEAGALPSEQRGTG